MIYETNGISCGEAAGGLSSGASRWAEPEYSDLLDLVCVLHRQPEGLRRWSVMRAIRARREKAGRQISPRFETEIERSFRKHCSEGASAPGDNPAQKSLFYRPKDRAGEVWAVDAGRATEWLRTDVIEIAQ